MKEFYMIMQYIRVCRELIRSDLEVFKQNIFDKIIDLTIWVVLTIVVTGYVMPYFGLAADFGVFQLGGVLAATGLFELYGNVVELVSDFEGDRVIDYNVTLPIPSWLALLSKSAYYFVIYVTLALVMFPVGKLCLWQQLDLTQICYPKLVVALLFQSMFYACFVLGVASITANMTKLGTVWSRFIFPLWFMGGFQFSWMALHQVMPVVAYVNLLNPIIYITEAVRVALLGQSGFINFWLCLLAITLFSAISLYSGMHVVKKRLDFV